MKNKHLIWFWDQKQQDIPRPAVLNSLIDVPALE